MSPPRALSVVLALPEPGWRSRFERLLGSIAPLAVTPASSASAAIAAALAPRAELLVIADGFADGDAAAVIARVRARADRFMLPIVYVGLRLHRARKLAALAAGATEALDWPLDEPEAVLRLRKELRLALAAAAPPPAPPLALPGDAWLDLEGRRLSWPEGELALTPAEAALAGALAREPQKGLPAPALSVVALGRLAASPAETAVVHTHVRNLRRKLTAAGAPVALAREAGAYRWQKAQASADRTR